MNPGAVHLENANGSGEPTWTKERKWIKKRKWTREVVDQREDVMSPNSPNQNKDLSVSAVTKSTWGDGFLF